MKRLLFWLADRPFVSLALLVLVTAAFALQLPKLRIDESAEGLMVENDPARDYYAQVTRRFGSDNLTIVLVKADDVFTPVTLGVVRRISEGLEGSTGSRGSRASRRCETSGPGATRWTPSP